MVVRFISDYRFNKNGYICLFGLYPLSESFYNKELQKAFNKSLLNPLHGKFLEFYLKFKGYSKYDLKTVDGPYLMDKLLELNLSHYFFGTTPDTLVKIQEKIAHGYPKANVLGCKAPPYFEPENIVKNNFLEKDFKEIAQHKPNIIWIGLGGVKQDLVMYHYSKYCENSLMIGVGAAFDYFAGNLSLSSQSVKSLGLRWLYRGFFQPKTFKRTYKTIKNIILS